MVQSKSKSTLIGEFFVLFGNLTHYGLFSEKKTGGNVSRCTKMVEITNVFDTFQFFVLNVLQHMHHFHIYAEVYVGKSHLIPLKYSEV